MEATIIRLPFRVPNPTGIKINTGYLNVLQMILHHNWGDIATYPAQTNPAPVGTVFKNLSKNTDRAAMGMQVYGNVMPYDATGGFLSMLVLNPNMSATEVMPFSGQSTDMFLKGRVRFPSGYGSGFQRFVSHPSTAYAIGNDNQDANFAIGFNPTASKLYFYAMGIKVGTEVTVAKDVWLDVALYIRPKGVDGTGNSGVIECYVDGVLVMQNTTELLAFKAESGKLRLRPTSGNFFEVSQFYILSGIKAAGLDIRYYL